MPPGGWSAARLLDAPHRLCFFVAGLQWAGAAAWWVLVQWSPTLAGGQAGAAGGAWAWQLPPSVAHGLWFTLGAMPLFIAGFMCTAGPKWLRQPPVPAPALLPGVAAFNLGWVPAAVGWHLHAGWAAAGLALAACGWAALVWRIGALVLRSRLADRRHAVWVLLGCVLLLACLAAAALALAGQALGAAAHRLAAGQALLAVLPRLALAGLALVFLAVSHRMLPFLGGGIWAALDGRWPGWPLWLVLSVPLVQAVQALWPLLAPGAVPAAVPAGWAGLQHWCAAAAGLHLLLPAAVCGWMALRWTRQRALRQPLVAMLFCAFVWWDVSLWLGALAHWPGWAPGTAGALRMAALHALSIGFLGGTLLVMASRVSSTHSGRPQAIDRTARVLFGLLQLALLLRLAALAAGTAPGPWLAGAAGAWAAVAGGWAWRHGRWLGSPRADGRPG